MTLILYIPFCVIFILALERYAFTKGWLLVACFSTVFIIVGGTVSLIVKEHRLKRRVIAADNRICPNCGYSLLGHNVEGNCPECGEAFTPTSLEAAWREIRRCI